MALSMPGELYFLHTGWNKNKTPLLPLLYNKSIQNITRKQNQNIPPYLNPHTLSSYIHNLYTAYGLKKLTLL